MTDANSSLPIRDKPPTSSSLNKKLIMVLAALVIIILLLALIFAFDTSVEKKQQATRDKVTPATVINSNIKKLPANYQDNKKISNYLAAKNGDNSAALLLEIERLKTSQANLAHQITVLQQHHTQPMQPARQPMKNDLNWRQAAHSHIFFSTMTHRAIQHPLLISQKSTKSIAHKSSSYQQQNMQHQKLDFVGNLPKQNAIYNEYQMVKPDSPYEVQAGTIIPAVLITVVNTSLPGTAVAQVREDIYNSVNGQYLLIPKGSKMIGKYDSQVAYGQERILLVFDRIIMPNGNSIQLSNFTAADMQGASGLKANVDNHWLRILGAATISSVLSLGSGIAAENYTSNTNYYPTAQQAALYGVANSISTTGQQLTSRAINIQPLLTIAPGYEFNVIVNKDIILVPYGK